VAGEFREGGLGARGDGTGVLGTDGGSLLDGGLAALGGNAALRRLAYTGLPLGLLLALALTALGTGCALRRKGVSPRPV
jgi:hypothetical protein